MAVPVLPQSQVPRATDIPAPRDAEISTERPAADDLLEPTSAIARPEAGQGSGRLGPRLPKIVLATVVMAVLAISVVAAALGVGGHGHPSPSTGAGPASPARPLTVDPRTGQWFPGQTADSRFGFPGESALASTSSR